MGEREEEQETDRGQRCEIFFFRGEDNQKVLWDVWCVRKKK